MESVIQSRYAKIPFAKKGYTYVYMGDTIGGMPSDPSCYTDGHIDYGKVKDKDFFKAGSLRLLTAAEKELRVAI